MEKQENGQFFEKVANALRKAAVELEEFQVTADKGMEEVKEKYEEAKKRFNEIVEEAKIARNVGQERYEELKQQFDELRVQLNLGKAETLEAFQAQKKKILTALHELEVKIKTNEALTRMYAFVLIEIEKFKVQLEILEPKFEKGKEFAKTSFEKGKQEFEDLIEKLNIKLGKKEEASQWDHFQNEISEAFVHFKNAFSKP